MRTRRRVLLAAGQTAAILGSTALAGCSSDTETDQGKSRVPNEPDYKGWFDGVSNYDGTIDEREREEVTVTVGARGNAGYYAFGPAAVAVSPGTAVTWEWSGRGGAHNVVTEDAVVDSGAPVDEDGKTVTHAFENPAVYRYACQPHRGLGMRGAVFVALGRPE